METSQYLDIFIDESTEHMDTLYDQLLELEKQPEEPSFMEAIFRAAHTLKGMSATMEFDDLAKLTHRLENVFDAIRYDKIQVQTEMMDHMFEAVDALNEMVEDIAGGGEGKKDVSSIVAQLEQIEKDETPVADGEGIPSTNQASNTPTDMLELDEFQITILSESKEQGYDNFEIRVQLREDCLLKGARVYMVFELLEKMGEVVHSDPEVQELEEENFDNSFKLLFVSKMPQEEIQSKLRKVSEVDVVAVESFSVEAYKEHIKEGQGEKNELKTPTMDQEKEDKPKKDTAKATKAAPTKTIRVNIERLDTLMNLFEELVIDRGRLEQISTDLKNTELQETVERMTRVSSDLQSIILTMRMVPIDTVFNRFPRMIRQLARDLHKEVNVDIIGADTELDRTVIDEIGDPLVHLIRNAMDHGIETPEERVQLDKPRQGQITLEAYHSGNHVFVEIIDDGAGIDKERVKHKAIEKGIVTEVEAEAMTDPQIYELILASGFSTNTVISDVSGRGVGLDVVKNTIESLGGSITIDAIPHKGSTFTIQLPLTLSIISVLLVELEKEKYAIPLSSIIETTVLHKAEIFNAHHNKVIDFRGNVVPLAFLNEIFDVPEEEKEEDDYISVVIVRKGNRLTGLVVNAFIGQQEIVLKSLGNYLTNVFAISGATILGDGEVALVIDTNALIK